jgi:hypothetical protein
VLLTTLLWVEGCLPDQTQPKTCEGHRKGVMGLMGLMVLPVLPLLRTRIWIRDMEDRRTQAMVDNKDLPPLMTFMIITMLGTAGVVNTHPIICLQDSKICRISMPSPRNLREAHLISTCRSDPTSKRSGGQCGFRK